MLNFTILVYYISFVWSLFAIALAGCVIRAYRLLTGGHDPREYLIGVLTLLIVFLAFTFHFSSLDVRDMNVGLPSHVEMPTRTLNPLPCNETVLGDTFMPAALPWALEVPWLIVVVGVLYALVIRRTRNRETAILVSLGVFIAYIAGGLFHPWLSPSKAGDIASVPMPPSPTPAPVVATVAPIDDRIWRDHLSDVLIPSQARAGSILDGSIIVQNASSMAWGPPNAPEVHLGFHWRAQSGKIIGEGRADLPHVFGSMEKHRVAFAAQAPSVPGKYQLQFDLLVESVSWFADHNNSIETAQLTVYK